MEDEEPTNFGHRNNINPNGGTTSQKASALTCNFWAMVVPCTSARWRHNIYLIFRGNELYFERTKYILRERNNNTEFPNMSL